MKKEMNNKGFSLVELIIVIAIMAVLMGVLAPQLIGKIEESKIQSDRSAVAEVANAIKIAMAKEAVFDEVDTGTTVKVGKGTVTVSLAGGASTTALKDALDEAIPDGVKFSSKKFGGSQGEVTIDITIDGTTFSLSTTDAAKMTDADPAPAKYNF